jgi:ribonuclease P protein component
VHNSERKPIVSLTKRSEFVTISQNGKKFITPRFVLQYRKACELSGPIRLGITVTKRHGGAVIRNRMRRRLREAARQVFPNSARPGYDYVLIGRAPVLTCSFDQLMKDMNFALSRIHKPD